MEYNLTIHETETAVLINIENEPDQNFIEYRNQSGSLRRVVIVGLNPNLQLKQISIDYCKQTIFHNKVIETEPFNITSTVAYDYIYNVKTPEAIGLAITKHLINAYLFHKFGVRCFTESGEFYQYELPPITEEE